MILIKEGLTALLTAAFLVAAFVWLFRPARTRYGIVWFFMMVFAATWAGGLWIRPLGAPVEEVYWLTFVVAGVIATGLIGLFVPRRPPHGRHETLHRLEQIKQGHDLQEATTLTLSVLFWVLFVLLVIGIVIRYVIQG